MTKHVKKVAKYIRNEEIVDNYRPDIKASNGFSVTYPSSIEFSNAILNINLDIASRFN